MPRKASVIKSGETLLTAALAAQWDVAARAQDRLQQLLAGAIASRSREDVEMIGAAFDKAHKTVVYAHDTPSALDATACAWMLKSCAAIAGLATREIPLKPPALTAAEGTVRERILCTLHDTPDRRLMNHELAIATGAAPATVARILPVLRMDGSIATKQIGAAKLNWLTPSGLAEAAKLKAAHAPTPISVEEALKQNSLVIAVWSRNLKTQRDGPWASAPGA